ncbi:MAG: Bacterial regulatory protein luxR family [Patescibacteria group bacterium]|jgi:predicted DNA-binding protein YlxM (UPF0122 family)|nr:Bacterial regulatory protein luxR family [Patescibacteria group bacterium]
MASRNTGLVKYSLMKLEHEQIHPSANLETQPVNPKKAKIASFFELYSSITQEKALTLEPHEERVAISLAAMTENPNHLRTLSDLWNVPEEQLRVGIRDAYYEPQIKAVAFEIFDRMKTPMKLTLKDRTKDQPIKERIKLLWEMLPADLLTQHQQDIASYANQGLTNSEIAEIMNIKPQSVAVILVNIRNRLDPFIAEAGLIKVSQLPGDATSSAKKGWIEAEKLLRMYYTTPSEARKFNARRPIVDENLLEQDFILLSDRSQITEDEHRRLMEKIYSTRIKRKNNRLYVTRQFLEHFRSKNKPRQIYVEPPPGHVLLINCIPLPHDHPDRKYIYRTLRRRLQSGTYPSIRKNRNWFVVKDDVLPEIEHLMEKKNATPLS